MSAWEAREIHVYVKCMYIYLCKSMYGVLRKMVGSNVKY